MCRDRTINGRYGGGCLVYVSISLTFCQQTNLQIDFFENIWVDVKVSGKTYAINALYRPPKHTSDDHASFLSSTEILLSRLNTYNAYKKIIMSDLNFGNCFSKYPLLEHKPLDSTAPEFF